MKVVFYPHKWAVIGGVIFCLANEEALAKNKRKNISDPELAAARALVNLHKILGRKISSRQKRQLQNITGRLKKSKLFSQYRHIPKAAHQFTLPAMTLNYVKKCSSFSMLRPQKTTILGPLFRRKIGRLCWKKFFKTVGARPWKGNKAHLLPIANAIPRLLEKDLTRNFGQFLSRLPKESPELASLSEKIRHHYKSRQMRPSEHILPHVIMDSEFTGFIQKNGFLDKTSEKYFYAEFKHFIEDIRNNYQQSDYGEVREIMQDVVRFHEANKAYLSNKKTWKSLILTGKRMVRLKQMNLALEFFKTSQEIISGENQFESSFQRLFTLLLNEKIYQGMSYIKAQEIIDHFPQLDSKFQFWIARTCELNKEYAKAKKLYLKIIEDNPLSFYAILALDKLKKFQPHYSYDFFIKDAGTTGTFKGKYTLEAQRNLKRLSYFAKVDYGLFVSKTIHHLLEKSVKNFQRPNESGHTVAKQHLYTTLINALGENAQHLEAFKLTSRLVDQNALQLNRHILKILFPKKFLKEIKANRPSFDPLIVLGLIRQESAFDPRAKSRVGARGLMQIMPATARYYQKLKNRNELYNIRPNLKIGIKYLEKLLKENDGNLIYALAAYNAGEGNLNRWKKSILKFDDPVKNIELIPFRETRNYVKLVFRNLYFYNLLNGNKNFLEKKVETNFRVSLQNAGK